MINNLRPFFAFIDIDFIQSFFDICLTVYFVRFLKFIFQNRFFVLNFFKSLPKINNRQQSDHTLDTYLEDVAVIKEKFLYLIKVEEKVDLELEKNQLANSHRQ